VNVRPKTALLLLALAPAFFAACDGGDTSDPGAPDGAGQNAPSEAGEAPESAAPVEGVALAEIDASDVPTGELGVGVISSGTAEAPIPEPTPEPPEVSGRSRRVNEAELPGLVRFTLYKPTFMPEESYTVAPIITEPDPDGSTEGLPSVATGYTIADQHSLAYVLSPAGEGPMPIGDGTAEEITIGGLPATLYENSQGKLVIVWERGDTRIEVKSAGLARDVVLQIAEGLQPIE